MEIDHQMFSGQTVVKTELITTNQIYNFFEKDIHFLKHRIQKIHYQFNYTHTITVYHIQWNYFIIFKKKMGSNWI